MAEYISNRVPYCAGSKTNKHYLHTNTQTHYSTLVEEIVENERNKFIKENQDLINSNNFQDFYLKVFTHFKLDARYLIPEFAKIFHQCDIDDLKFMNSLPPFYLYGNQFITKFTILANIREIHPDSFRGAPNLDKFIWETKLIDDDSNSLPSMFDIYYALKPSRSYKDIIIEFPEHNYDRDWVKRLKRFLKERSKAKQEYLSKLYIKFKNKKKSIKII